MKNYIITLTGDLGSGKGTISNILKENSVFITYSTGDVQREIAKKYNMTTLELNKYAEQHPEIDDEIDCCFSELAKVKDNIIIDSRMAWHFIPSSFKVYIKVDINESAKRIFNANRGESETYKDIDDAKSKILERKQSENRRYLKKYGVDCSDMNNFDLVLDSTHLSPEELTQMILDGARKYFEK